MSNAHESLKIVDARVKRLRIPYIEQPGFQVGYDRDRELLLVEIETAASKVAQEP